nr:MAG TPA: Insertion element 4 transposase N-terminal [Caudoviricetes sp.]
MVEGYNEYRRRFFTPFRMTWRFLVASLARNDKSRRGVRKEIPHVCSE